MSLAGQPRLVAPTPFDWKLASEQARRVRVGLENLGFVSQIRVSLLMATQTFDQFWMYYLSEHSRKGTRILHFIGTALALLALMAGVVMFRPLVAIVGVAAGYALASSAHFLVEGNRPVLRHPIWSIRADLLMLYLWLTGRLHNELARAGIGVVSQTVRRS
jgi:hypothetical protein